jgi:hypothetical protein
MARLTTRRLGWIGLLAVLALILVSSAASAKWSIGELGKAPVGTPGKTGSITPCGAARALERTHYALAVTELTTLLNDPTYGGCAARTLIEAGQSKTATIHLCDFWQKLADDGLTDNAKDAYKAALTDPQLSGCAERGLKKLHDDGNVVTLREVFRAVVTFLRTTYPWMVLIALVCLVYAFLSRKRVSIISSKDDQAFASQIVQAVNAAGDTRVAGPLKVLTGSDDGLPDDVVTDLSKLFGVPSAIPVGTLLKLATSLLRRSLTVTWAQAGGWATADLVLQKRWPLRRNGLRVRRAHLALGLGTRSPTDQQAVLALAAGAWLVGVLSLGRQPRSDDKARVLLAQAWFKAGAYYQSINDSEVARLCYAAMPREVKVAQAPVAMVGARLNTASLLAGEGRWDEMEVLLAGLVDEVKEVKGDDKTTFSGDVLTVGARLKSARWLAAAGRWDEMKVLLVSLVNEVNETDGSRAFTGDALADLKRRAVYVTAIDQVNRLAALTAANAAATSASSKALAKADAKASAAGRAEADPKATSKAKARAAAKKQAACKAKVAAQSAAAAADAAHTSAETAAKGAAAAVLSERKLLMDKVIGAPVAPLSSSVTLLASMKLTAICAALLGAEPGTDPKTPEFAEIEDAIRLTDLHLPATAGPRPPLNAAAYYDAACAASLALTQDPPRIQEAGIAWLKRAIAITPADRRDRLRAAAAVDPCLAALKAAPGETTFDDAVGTAPPTPPQQLDVELAFKAPKPHGSSGR